MEQLWPPPSRPVNDTELETLYRYPAQPGDATWVAVNSVTSLDGAIELDGRSAGLSTPGDRRVYQLGSDLADVVLLGARTAVAENYPGLQPTPATAARRRRHGLAPVAPLALVTTGASLPPDVAAITNVLASSIVLTCEAAPARQRHAWAEAGAHVVVAGRQRVDLPAALANLAAAGLRRIDCEGGPRLVGELLARDLVDELRLSISPIAVAGPAGRVAATPTQMPTPSSFDVASLLIDNGTLLVRYISSPPSSDLHAAESSQVTSRRQTISHSPAGVRTS